MLQDLNNRGISRSSVGRGIRRCEAIGFAVLAALGLSLNGAGGRLAGAAQKEVATQHASARGRKVVRVLEKYEAANYGSGGASPNGFQPWC